MLMKLMPRNPHVNDERPPAKGRGTSARLFWVLGLVAGVAIGVVAAFGPAGAGQLPGA